MLRNFSTLTIKKTAQFTLLFCCCLLFSLKHVTAQETFYVSKLGDNSDGKSWQTAWRELDQINWQNIDAGALIYLDGGQQEMIYQSTLSINTSGQEE